MILINNLYDILEVTKEDNCVIYSISLNDNCAIYKAHFPEMPITPGVCIIQMAKELMEETLGLKLQIKTVKNAKFITALLPQGQSINITLSNIKHDDTIISAQALVSGDSIVYAKISLQTIIA